MPYCVRCRADSNYVYKYIVCKADMCSRCLENGQLCYKCRKHKKYDTHNDACVLQ